MPCADRWQSRAGFGLNKEVEEKRKLTCNVKCHSPGVNQRKTRPQSLKRSSTGGFQGESRPQGSTHGFREQFVFQKGRRKNHKTDLRRLRRPEPPHAVSGCDYVQSQSSPLSLASISASLPRLRLSPGSKAGNGAGCTKEYLRESR